MPKVLLLLSANHPYLGVVTGRHPSSNLLKGAGRAPKDGAGIPGKEMTANEKRILTDSQSYVVMELQRNALTDSVRRRRFVRLLRRVTGNFGVALAGD